MFSCFEEKMANLKNDVQL
ncbi:hypothetical protein LINPERHAP1_LOCUS34547 [Linum perenne]